MRLNINSVLDTLGFTLFLFCCLCADSLMECLGAACLPVMLALYALACYLLRLSDRLGRRCILVGKRRI